MKLSHNTEIAIAFVVFVLALTLLIVAAVHGPANEYSQAAVAMIVLLCLAIMALDATWICRDRSQAEVYGEASGP